MPSPCCLCGSSAFTPRTPVPSQFDGREFTPVRCLGCGLVGLDPRLPLDELLAYYEGLDTREDLEAKIRARFQPRVRWVTEQVPGRGRLFVEVPNFHSLGVLWGGRHWVHFDVPYHQHFFTPDTLSRLCEKAGLEVLETSRRPLDSDWWSLKRTLQRRLERFPGRLVRPLVSFLPVAKLLAWLGAAAGRTETFQLLARRRG